jgi:hypothetical protein
MLDVKPYHIQSVVKDAGFGGTCPIIVRANNKEYVLKTREDGTNPKDLGVFNEALAYQLLNYLGINIAPQEIVYLYIDDDFIDMAQTACDEDIIQAESLEYIKESKGFNLGVEYLHYAMEPLNEIINNDTFIKDIAHIDNFIMNCDRSKGNINILQDKLDQRKYYAIDFGNALADGICYEKIQNGEANIFINGAYSHCNTTLSRRYILKNDTQRLIKRGRNIKENMANIRQILADIIGSFPPDWEPILHKNDIIDVIATRLKSRKIFEISDTSKCNCLY